MEPFKPKDTRVTLDKDAFVDTVRKTLTKKKKPVKFTWKGAANFAQGFLNTNPFSKIKQHRLKELMEGSRAKEKDYIDFFEDMEKSFYGGAQNILYSFGDLVTTGIDAAKDTNLTEALDKVYKENKIKDPETLLGTVNKVLIEYGVPGGAVFKIMNRAKKMFRGKKALTAAAAATGTVAKGTQIAKRSGYMAGAFGATDFLVARPEVETFFLDKESEEGLEGRDLALTRFRNRLRFGAEGTLIGGGFTLLGKPMAKIATVGAKYGLMKPAGYALRGVDLAVRPVTWLAANIPGSAKAGKAIRGASSYVIDKSLSTVLAGNPKKQLPAFDQWRMFSTKSSDPLQKRLKKLDNFLAAFRSVGKYTGLGFQLTSEAKREIKARSRTIEKYLESIEKKSYDLAKRFEGQYNTASTSPAGQDYYLDRVLAYLKGQLKKSDLPKELQGTAESLQKELVNTKKTFAELLPEDELKDFMLNNLKTYMRKSFATFTNPEYMADPKIKQAASKWILENVVKRNPDIKKEAIKTLKTSKMTDQQALKEMADTMMEKTLTNLQNKMVLDPLRITTTMYLKDHFTI
jgi:hypothetical protein